MTSTISAPEKTPIIFQNPDGSYTEGLPNGYKYPTPSRSSEASHPWMFLGSGNPAETNHDVPPPEEDDFDYTIARLDTSFSFSSAGTRQFPSLRKRTLSRTRCSRREFSGVHFPSRWDTA
eukprot:GEMP01086765.1.p1 GENE.GEMP01086765.1~~GEMP01086765.1.p1  ORF type:complete len:120 (+),score=16.22 GEMP01086765.1:351-710(+)